jgi:transcriptional regulator with XRE-family HTH domain
VQLQLLASGCLHGRVAFLPWVPIRLKCLKQREPVPEPTAVGEHIRKRRLELGLTLKEAGKLLGTGGWSIINWEKGRTVPAVYRLPAIIYFLGYSPVPEPRTIAERLLAKRLERGWSRKIASRYWGIDETTLRDWEHGKIILFRKHRKLVAEMLGIAGSELDVEMKARWIAAHGPT